MGKGKRTAPTKLTAGGGFSFENAVAAHVLSLLLTGRPLMNQPGGVVARLDFQVVADGWFIDDLLLTIVDGGASSQLAISIKSNQQVTSSGLPAEFVRLAWQQWLALSTDERRRTWLALATGSLPVTVRRAWHSLLAKATTNDPANLAARIHKPRYANQIQRNLFDSLRCPADLRPEGYQAKDIASLLAHTRVLDSDFENDPSESEGSAIEQCRAATRSQKLEDAKALWSELVAVARRHNETGGYLDLAKVVALLRGKVSLRDHPDYRGDWSRLSRHTEESLGSIKDTVGGRVVIDRTTEADDVYRLLSTNGAASLLGPSGSGKSALAKRVAGDARFDRVIWVDDHLLRQPNLTTVEASLGIEHEIPVLMTTAAGSQCLLIVDALERFSELGLRNAAVLLKNTKAVSADANWAVLLTSQIHGYRSATTTLAQFGVTVDSFGVSALGVLQAEDLRAVWTAFPALQDLYRQPHLRRVLSNPKVLDVVATGLSLGTTFDADQCVGESGVVAWFWEGVVASGDDAIGKARLLQRIAEHEGDQFTSGIEIVRLGQAEADRVDSLCNTGLVQVKKDRCHFSHDLYGDWARMRVLQSKADELVSFVRDRAEHPRWHAAIRLYGLSLLESDTGDLLAWRDCLDTFSPEPGRYDVVTDLVLESLAFAPDSEAALYQCWPILMRDRGELLARLLNRFLHVATIPDPRLAALDLGSPSVAVAATYRIPYSPAWLPILRFLQQHHAQVVDTVPHLAARLAAVWLGGTPGSWAGRQEAAQLALNCARWAGSAKDVFFRDDVDVEIFRAALAAAEDLPDSVADWALLMAKRTSSPGPETSEQESEPSAERPWPDGPRARVDEGFRRACFGTSNSLLPLIRVRPRVALELILALAIEAPRVRSPYGGEDSLLARDFGVESIRDWLTPMYFWGPFLLFLRESPAMGLEVIMRLINHATDRWAERDVPRDVPTPCVVVPMELDATWIGDMRVYLWFRDRLVSSRCLVSALMALEKWLYDIASDKDALTERVTEILEKSHSVAIAGVLVTVAKRHPDMLNSQLRPLLGVWQLYDWEHRFEVEGDVQIPMSWTHWGEQIFEIIKEWHSMPHRKHRFEDLAISKLLTDSEVSAFYEGVRPAWQADLQKLETENQDSRSLARLIALFDRENYRMTPESDGRIRVEFVAPEPLRSRLESEGEKSRRRLRVMLFALQCRQLLDEGVPIPSENLDEFWSSLRAIAAHAEEGDVEVPEEYFANAICGGVAVLVRLHRELLLDKPEREEWCVNQVASIINRPPTPSDLSVPQDVSTHRWDSFLAELAPTWLEESPSDAAVRALVARLSLSYYYRTTGILLRAAFRLRDRLGDDFLRLHNLVMSWAALRTVHDLARRFEQQSTRTERRYESLCTSFIAERTPLEPLSWQRLARCALRQRDRVLDRAYGRDLWAEPEPGEADQSTGSKRSTNHPGLDLSVTEQACAWIPRLSEAKSEAERAWWISIWREALGVTLRMCAPLEEEGAKEPSGTPYDWDHFLFDRIAALICDMRPAEAPESFWQPILDLGAGAHYWVADFIRSWFTQGLDSAPDSATFGRHWTAMIDYALAAPAWRLGDGRGPYHLQELWSELMGLSWGRERIGLVAFSNTIASMTAQYSAWAEMCLRFEDAATRFAGFLCMPGAQPLLDTGIIWLSDASSTDAWRRGTYVETVVRLLEHCWRNRRPKFSADGPQRRAFHKLLKLVADRQDRAALELQDRLRRGTE